MFLSSEKMAQGKNSSPAKYTGKAREPRGRIHERGYGRHSRDALRKRAFRTCERSFHRCARGSSRTLFEIASGGSLFLDEIGNLSPLASQAKLLTILDSRQVTRAGSNKARVPWISVSSVPRTAPSRRWQVRSEFREDLLYRINTVEICLPPLRERAGDVPLLARHYLDIYARKYSADRHHHQPTQDNGKTRTIHHGQGACGNFNMPWSGPLLVAKEPLLQPSDFPPFSTATQPGDREPSAGEIITSRPSKSPSYGRVLARHNGNVTQAAKELGLTRAALYRRLEKHGL